MCGDRLKVLDLSITNISGEGITTSCPQLQKLSLEHCENLTDPGLENMLRLWGGALKELYLSGTNISGEGISTPCPALQKLSLDICCDLTGPGLKNMLSLWRDELTELYLYGTNIFGEDIHDIQARYPHLKVVKNYQN